MERTSFKESLQHGSAEFPVAVYNMKFDKKQQMLASLHYHKEFEFLVITEGRICVQIEEKNYELKSGEGIFINSGCLHTITTEGDGSGQNGFIAVVFDETLICSRQESVFKRYIGPLKNGNLEVPLLLTKQCCEKLISVCDAYEESKFGSELYIKHCLLEVIYKIMEHAVRAEVSVQSAKSNLVKEVLEFIKEHYAEQISLTEMAEHVHVSKEYLCRIFHMLSDVSPVEYLNRYRIQQSTVLLLQADVRISDIALACGFNHSSYFGKMFLNYMGCTPTEYRRNNVSKSL